MISDKSAIRRILVITLSNMGDIILTTPVIRTLVNEFPGARVDVMCGPQGKDIFEFDPDIFKLIIYNKHSPISEKRRLQIKLKNLSYDLVVDIRNTVFPLLIGPKFRTATIRSFPSSVYHRKKRHLYLLKSLGIKKFVEDAYIHIPPEDDKYAEELIRASNITGPMVLVNAGAKSHLKRWEAGGFAEAADRLISECGADVVFVGLKEDEETVENIIARMKHKDKRHNFVNRTNIRQLGALLKRAKLLITNDSAPLHLACAVGAKVLAIFGPTDPKKYGPTGEFDIVINKKLSCSPCESAECAHDYECMKIIAPDEVFDAAKGILEGYE